MECLISVKRTHTRKMETSGKTREAVLVKDFTVVPIKFEESSCACHNIYFKEHSLHREDTKPKGRTLFITNIPPYCTTEVLHRLFSQFGNIQAAFFSEDEKPQNKSRRNKIQLKNSFIENISTKGFKTAYVLYRDKNSIVRALKASYDKPFIISTPTQPVLTGLRKWQKEYEVKHTDWNELQEEIDEYMKGYDSSLSKKIEEEKEKEGVADEEGWVTVTKHGKLKPTSRTEVNQRKLTKKDRKKKKERELLNFYTFQIKQEKQDRIAALRQKFEEDKVKIAQMKSARKFKPY
ncbi:hypothetical protein LOTGIDRAFT_229333 [Lottia gigantea]|uniref:RRM domain-containing protein n=1 Tax=Lottia gigantea TaxID=225164 RepID=V3ZX42_LOTGI|nr:hypothetical protein LOTGIDRAFT_229333 [Lottia gigantea]ESO87195.1 hypothetical protein LOTGIDRAFT_229333 [Lottia gigantea]